MSQCWNYESIYIGNDLLHWFALLWRRAWKLRLQITRFDRCEDGQFLDLVKVVCNPINEFMAEATKLFLIHVAQRWREACLERFRFTHGCVSYTDLGLYKEERLLFRTSREGGQAQRAPPLLRQRKLQVRSSVYRYQSHALTLERGRASLAHLPYLFLLKVICSC